MRAVVVGMGVQGRKRLTLAGSDAVATVDPVADSVDYRSIQDVPVDTYDAAIVCTPDDAKSEILEYLLSHRKHIMVEKPLLLDEPDQYLRLQQVCDEAGTACYTAYNHRFEPNIVRLKELLETNVLGEIYTARLFYGNGTAQDVIDSPWRDQGDGVLPDLGSHLLDLVLFLLGPVSGEFEPWSMRSFETQSFDHVLFGSKGTPFLELAATHLSWKNSFSVDILAEKGSAHLHGLCKWGPSTLTMRSRVFPSGVPHEEIQTAEGADPTWALEYDYFRGLCKTGGNNLGNDIWINDTLAQIANPVGAQRA